MVFWHERCQIKFYSPNSLIPKKNTLQVSGHVDADLLSEFIERFLLDCNATSVRWQGHGLIVALLRNASADFQTMVIDIFWKLWPHLPCYGRKAAQFVDLVRI